MTLRFKPGAAYYVEERIWHPTETKQHNPDDSLTLRFQALRARHATRWKIVSPGGKPKMRGNTRKRRRFPESRIRPRSSPQTGLASRRWTAR